MFKSGLAGVLKGAMQGALVCLVFNMFAAHADQSEDEDWMAELVDRVERLVEVPFPELNLPHVSRLQGVTIISPVGERSGHVWVYQLASDKEQSVKLYAYLRPFDDEAAGRPLTCDYAFELGAREARYLVGLAKRALHCEKSFAVRSASVFPRSCLLDGHAPPPVCIGGATSLIRLKTSDGDEHRIATKCGAYDEAGQFMDAIKTFAHPHYNRPNASCEQNQTPENLINTSEE